MKCNTRTKKGEFVRGENGKTCFIGIEESFLAMHVRLPRKDDPDMPAKYDLWQSEIDNSKPWDSYFPGISKRL